jgi:hypothetical protein
MLRLREFVTKKIITYLISYMSYLLSKYNQNRLTDFESFVVTQGLAGKIKMSPFKIDKILCAYGVYH